MCTQSQKEKIIGSDERDEDGVVCRVCSNVLLVPANTVLNTHNKSVIVFFDGVWFACVTAADPYVNAYRTVLSNLPCVQGAHA
eukprot:m.512182 g.512182  ORF g.512182 m.512182 type:complete len:83 (-) comp57434_c0_seq50:16-264(-)